jgi:prepilin-type N-terminal cleavage/methylation domain-containing protein
MEYATTKRRLNRLSARTDGGFTFIEVTVALALLAVAASILIGMQGAAVRRTLRDTNAQTAMLVARRIMASIEILSDAEFSLATQSNAPVKDLMQQLNITGLGERTESPALDAMTASVSVDDIEIPIPMNESVEQMRRIVLRLSWGTGSDESIQLVYQRPRQQ